MRLCFRRPIMWCHRKKWTQRVTVSRQNWKRGSGILRVKISCWKRSVSRSARILILKWWRKPDFVAASKTIPAIWQDVPREKCRRHWWIIFRTTFWLLWMSPTLRFRRCVECMQGIAQGSRHWWTMDSVCRPHSITARLILKSLRARLIRCCLYQLRRMSMRTSMNCCVWSRLSVRPDFWTRRFPCDRLRGRSMIWSGKLTKRRKITIKCWSRHWPSVWRRIWHSIWANLASV